MNSRGRSKTPIVMALRESSAIMCALCCPYIVIVLVVHTGGSAVSLLRHLKDDDVTSFATLTQIGVNERPPLWSADQSSWLLTLRSRVRFPALSDFMGSSGSGTGSTQRL
jgi:hypothetical protein